jgi:hypothetical protein
MVSEVLIRKFELVDLASLYELIQHTIDTAYPGVYPAEAIAFFKNYHSNGHIIDDAVQGGTLVADYHGVLAGTATLVGSNIRRMFVNTSY